ncbi:NUDIX hydrolase [Shewanella inventionis]|uniref:Phosphatase NudJ n=1 Tax=Shewanella inventionis TaxID=1738770 RepID=A0ABQ1IRM1_9GAMM|nr:NUDIX hydrolase [Shewanella inventionis]MCL1157154.1 NUDIX hydrolase [Shewanella inventionis]GGB49396.1 NUDIX hydrolase [Shewanella inventionis]
MTQRYKPNTTVACVIYSQGKFLLVEEVINGQMKFNQPAGHLEANESLIDACSREVLEETGLNIEPQAIVGIYQFSANDELAFVRYTFCITLDQPIETTPLDSAITRTHWLSREQISELGDQLRSPLVLKSIDDYIQQAGLLDQSPPATRDLTQKTNAKPCPHHLPLSLLNADYLHTR